jgi:glyoxylase-like metal-dependent hydrolase (beta-lactamase superfamily II)
MRHIIIASIAILAACAAPAATPPYYLVPGSVPPDRGPDGNSIFLEAPDGLILVDTGRHPDHAAKLLSYALSRKRPIAAIVNTHWHLDHTTGNHDIRQTYRRAEVYATTAIEGALVGFLGRNREQADPMIADPATPIERKAEILRGRSVIDNPDRLRPTRPVTESGPLTIAGRQFDAHVASFAATEADLWLYDRRAKLAIVGDLVVGIVPFMDTACPDGWRKALDEIAATPFVTLIPGHGVPMDRSQFLAWRSAFNNFVGCGRSARAKEECVAGWKRDAA